MCRKSDCRFPVKRSKYSQSKTSFLEKKMSAADELAKLGPLSKLKPEAMNAFGAFDAAVMADGAISKKNKELIAVAVALSTQCQYCLAIHTELAKKAGASEAELAEATFVAAALRAGAAITHGANHVIGK